MLCYKLILVAGVGTMSLFRSKEGERGVRGLSDKHVGTCEMISDV